MGDRMDTGHVGTGGGLAGTPHLTLCLYAGGFLNSTLPNTGMMLNQTEQNCHNIANNKSIRIDCNKFVCVFNMFIKFLFTMKRNFHTNERLVLFT